MPSFSPCLESALKTRRVCNCFLLTSITGANTLLTIVRTPIMFAWNIIAHLFRMFLGMPEPQLLSTYGQKTDGKKVDINKRNIIASIISVGAGILGFLMRGNRDENGTLLFEPLAEWMLFCSGYSSAFLIPIPIAGPFLYLLSHMFIKSGFWMSPFWLFVQKHVGEPKDGSSSMAEVWVNPVEQGHQPEGRRDICLHASGLLYPLQVDENVIDEESDKGKILRMFSILAYPALAFLSFYFWNGFDFLEWLKITIFTSESLKGPELAAFYAKFFPTK